MRVILLEIYFVLGPLYNSCFQSFSTQKAMKKKSSKKSRAMPALNTVILIA